LLLLLLRLLLLLCWLGPLRLPLRLLLGVLLLLLLDRLLLRPRRSLLLGSASIQVKPAMQATVGRCPPCRHLCCR
jgi:hypothetical protein